MKTLLVILCLAPVLPSHAGDEVKPLRGWTLRLCPGLDKAALDKALPLLQAQLDEIVRVVPARAVAELRKVTLWIHPEYPGVPPRAEYHPGEGWLRDNGRDPAMARGVEFTNLRIFEEECRRMPNFVLHELAHAYHDRALGFEHPEVIAAFKKARQQGLYERVERRDAKGLVRLARAYAMTNAKEYFAEGTEAFFSRNDFQPCTRDELKRHDPALHDLLAKLWGVAELR
jgi:dipeptidyl-peptidase-4